MRIDLHTHTTASDGTDSPAGLIEAAASAGLDVVAITDNDSAAGWPSAVAAVRQMRAAGRPAPTLVPGIEVSCERAGRSVHLLGYLLDPAHPPLVAELTRARDSRATRLERMVARLAEGGIPITYAAVLAHVPPGATPGRPHIADALVAAGVVAHRDEAFARWLHDASPYYVTHYAPDPARAVELVLAAGGVPVLAHPFSAGRSVAAVRRARRRAGRGRPRGAGGRTPRPRSGRRGASPVAGRGARAAGDRRERLPRHRQDRRARRAGHGPRCVAGHSGARARQSGAGVMVR